MAFGAPGWGRTTLAIDSASAGAGGTCSAGPGSSHADVRRRAVRRHSGTGCVVIARRLFVAVPASLPPTPRRRGRRARGCVSRRLGYGCWLFVGAPMSPVENEDGYDALRKAIRHRWTRKPATVRPWIVSRRAGPWGTDTASHVSGCSLSVSRTGRRSTRLNSTVRSGESCRSRSSRADSARRTALNCDAELDRSPPGALPACADEEPPPQPPTAVRQAGGIGRRARPSRRSLASRVPYPRHRRRH